MPLISIVIAFVPQSSCKELIALHDAGVLDIVSVGNDSEIEIADQGGIVYHYKDENDEAVAQSYQTFVDCVGQPHLDFAKFIFDGLKSAGAISAAQLAFKNQQIGADEMGKNEKVEELDEGSYMLNVPGITINDNFQIVDGNGNANPHIFIMAVPYIGGFNPDYSGIDFSEEASQRIIDQF
ncbi:MAG: hypothetical protein EOP00_32265 [Pedobacter sp.]|nr:MAG: hypothetical protein EOP00_32265 [Pedobacter sp.]